MSKMKPIIVPKSILEDEEVIVPSQDEEEGDDSSPSLSWTARNGRERSAYSIARVLHLIVMVPATRCIC